MKIEMSDGFRESVPAIQKIIAEYMEKYDLMGIRVIKRGEDFKFSFVFDEIGIETWKFD